MKIILLSLLIVSLSYSQNLEGKWFDENFDIFEFKSDSVLWGLNGRGKSYQFEYSDKTLEIKIISYLSFQKNNQWIREHPINLINVNFDSEAIFLTPKNKNAEENLFPGIEHIKLRKLSTLVPEQIHLEEMYFESSGCFGSCKPETFYLDEKLNFYFIGGYNLGERKEFFRGRISENDKRELESILSNGYIQNIPEYLGSSIDAQHFTIVIKRDGIIQRIEGTNIPTISWDMIFQLLDFHLQLQLAESEEFSISENVIQ